VGLLKDKAIYNIRSVYAYILLFEIGAPMLKKRKEK
jgi:hypothetical protein